jgi:hypothetical protein
MRSVEKNENPGTNPSIDDGKKEFAAITTRKMALLELYK